jgi:hypothetical protein
MFIRFSSHRAREYGLQALSRTPQAYWSMQRKTHPGGVYDVTEQEAEQIQAYSGHARFTVLRGPYDDLHHCWPA